jgi:hypothetical protein
MSSGGIAFRCLPIPCFSPNAANVQYVVKSACTKVRERNEVGEIWTIRKAYNSNDKERIICTPTFSQNGPNIKSKGEEDPCQRQKESYQRS